MAKRWKRLLICVASYFLLSFAVMCGAYIYAGNWGLSQLTVDKCALCLDYSINNNDGCCDLQSLQCVTYDFCEDKRAAAKASIEYGLKLVPWLLLYCLFVVVIFFVVPFLVLLFVFLFECLLALKNCFGERMEQGNYMRSMLILGIICTNLINYLRILNCKQEEEMRDGELLIALLNHPTEQQERQIADEQVLEPINFVASDNICSIDQTEMTDENKKTLRCGHTFHKECIQKWFENKPSSRRDCPNCRRFHRSIIAAA